jgi:hypothetical protein
MEHYKGTSEVDLILADKIRALRCQSNVSVH